MSRAVPLVLLCLGVACRGAPQPQPAAVEPAAAPAEAAGRTQVSGRAPAGALVALEPVSGALPLPAGGALMDQYSKQFVPTTLFVRVGQVVTFRNSEDQLHDVTIVRSRTGTTVFNVSQDPFHENRFTFDRPGEYDVNCDVHPGMRATIVASTTPYAAFADADGRFALADVAPGTYKLQVTSGGQMRERPVEIKGASVDVGEGR